MAKYHVYGLGAALVDTEVEVTDSDLSALGVEKGLMTLVDEARQQELIDHLSDHLVTSKRASGGSAANTIIAASYFGASTCYACKVADDDNGHFYLRDLSDAGVTHHRNGSLPAGTTGKCLVLITPDAERSMNTFLGISETIDTDNLDAEAIANSEYLYMEGYLVTSATGRPAAVAAREIAQQAGVKTAISLSDPAMVQFFKDGLQEMIGERVNLLFANRDEALGWTGADAIEDACERIKVTADCFAITLGADGALVYDGAALHKVEGVAANAIDTNGAGDMFAGAFLYGLSQGWDYPTSGRFACRAAAQVVSQYGPRLRAEQHRELLA
ncbi:adenosine kinase [Porticoccus sp. GXU_MW_L64]